MDEMDAMDGTDMPETDSNHEKRERRERSREPLARVLRGDVSFWVECWGRAVQLHVVEISKWIDACARRPKVTWLEVEQGVEEILSRRSPAALEVPRRFLAERDAECLPSPQQEDAGGVGCGTDLAPSVGEEASAELALDPDSVCVRPLGKSNELFEVLLGVRGVVLTRDALDELSRQSARCAGLEVYMPYRTLLKRSPVDRFGRDATATGRE
jgi:hypothetical protein